MAVFNPSEDCFMRMHFKNIDSIRGIKIINDASNRKYSDALLARDISNTRNVLLGPI